MNRWFHLPLVWLFNSRQRRAITVHAFSIYFAFVLARQFKAKCRQNFLVLASQLSLQLRDQTMRNLRKVQNRKIFLTSWRHAHIELSAQDVVSEWLSRIGMMLLYSAAFSQLSNSIGKVSPVSNVL